jgi:tryptophan synthase alpha subunit
MDLLQMGIDNWLNQEGSDVAQDYVTIADASMTHVINVMESNVAGEQLLDELGIPQSERIDFEEIQNFRNSVLDTFQVLATYLRVLEIAKRKNNESRRE